MTFPCFLLHHEYSRALGADLNARLSESVKARRVSRLSCEHAHACRTVHFVTSKLLLRALAHLLVQGWSKRLALFCVIPRPGSPGRWGEFTQPRAHLLLDHTCTILMYVTAHNAWRNHFVHSPKVTVQKRSARSD